MLPDLPICGETKSDRCLSLQNTKATWGKALKTCKDQGGELLNFRISGISGSDLTDYLQTVIPDGWEGVWTSGKTFGKQWYWTGSSNPIYLNDQGCYKKDVLNTDYMSDASSQLDPGTCEELCKDKEMRFASISFQGPPSDKKVECGCSNTFHYWQPETGCEIKCPEQPSPEPPSPEQPSPEQPRVERTFCGNEDRMLVYDLSGVEYDAWAEPTDRQKFMCAAMDKDHEFKWVERSCHNKYAHLCQYDVMDSSDCEHKHKGGVCFSDHTLGLTWWQAMEDCKKRNATLLVIRGHRIQAELEDYLNGFGENFWIGLTRWNWEWANPTDSKNELGPYINWKDMQPTDTFTKECLALNVTNGTNLGWENRDCLNQLESICVLYNYTFVETTPGTTQTAVTISQLQTGATGAATASLSSQSPASVQTKDDSEDDSSMLVVGIAIGASLAVIVMLILAAAIICVYRSKNKQKKAVYNHSAQEIAVPPPPVGYSNPVHTYDTPYEPRTYDLPPPPDYVEYDDAHRRVSGIYTDINELELDNGLPYQDLSKHQTVKQPYESLDTSSTKRPLTVNANGDAKYEDIEDKKEGKYEEIETKKDDKYEDVAAKKEGPSDRTSTYDSSGYLIATPSMIKRTEEEKIRLRKLKEMGDKIDEGSYEEGDEENNDVAMEYADVEGNPARKDDGDKADGEAPAVEKPYLRLVDVRPSTKESKL